MSDILRVVTSLVATVSVAYGHRLPVQTGPGSHPPSCTIVTVFFSRGGQSGRSVTLTTYSQLALRFKKE